IGELEVGRYATRRHRERWRGPNLRDPHRHDRRLLHTPSPGLHDGTRIVAETRQRQPAVILRGRTIVAAGFSRLLLDVQLQLIDAELVQLRELVTLLRCALAAITLEHVTRVV